MILSTMKDGSEILTVDTEDGILKIGSPPIELPGIMDSIQINASLQIDIAEVQGRSGKTKVVKGWNDADLMITLLLIDNPKAKMTRWSYLEQITQAFKKVTEEGVPKIYTLIHPMIGAWGATEFLFTNLESTEDRTRRVVTASLEFVEYETSSVIIQDRQGNATTQQASPAAPTSPAVSEKQGDALKKLEGIFG